MDLPGSKVTGTGTTNQAPTSVGKFFKACGSPIRASALQNFLWKKKKNKAKIPSGISVTRSSLEEAGLIHSPPVGKKGRGGSALYSPGVSPGAAHGVGTDLDDTNLVTYSSPVSQYLGGVIEPLEQLDIASARQAKIPFFLTQWFDADNPRSVEESVELQQELRSERAARRALLEELEAANKLPSPLPVMPLSFDLEACIEEANRQSEMHLSELETICEVDKESYEEFSILIENNENQVPNNTVPVQPQSPRVAGDETVINIGHESNTKTPVRLPQRSRRQVFFGGVMIQPDMICSAASPRSLGPQPADEVIVPPLLKEQQRSQQSAEQRERDATVHLRTSQQTSSPPAQFAPRPNLQQQTPSHRHIKARGQHVTFAEPPAEPLPIRQEANPTTHRPSEELRGHHQHMKIIKFSELHIRKQIGAGAFGRVYEAYWKTKPCAVKVLFAQEMHDDLVYEFESELEIMSVLRHPNITQLYGACLEPYHRAMVVELLPRGSLWGILRSNPYCLDDHVRRKWLIDTAKGMDYLHSFRSPILHRDLKSPNLLVDKNYTIKIADFGLSRVKVHVQVMTGNCGTIQWMAPEVLANKKYSEKADVYSFGIVLWEIYSGQVPYEGMQQIQTGLGVLNKNLRPKIPHACPKPIANLIKQCWDKDPKKRPSFETILKKFGVVQNVRQHPATIARAATI